MDTVAILRNTLYVAIAMPHLFYALLWTRPKIWKGFCKNLKVNEIKALTLIATILKVFQFFSTYRYVKAILPTTIGEVLLDMNSSTMMVSLMLIFVGQSLNIGVYNALGMKGVYYGVKFGEKIPWYEGFPFNVCPHPQYIGSSLTVWGVLLPFMATSVFFELFTVGCIWSSFYLLSSMIEST